MLPAHGPRRRISLGCVVMRETPEVFPTWCSRRRAARADVKANCAWRVGRQQRRLQPSTARTSAAAWLDIGHCGQQYRPAYRRYGMSAGQRFSVVRFERSSRRSADSTSSDVVRPCRAASRLRSAMTLSSMLSVVFIWEYVSHVWLYA